MSNEQRRKLSDTDVETIRRQYAEGATMKELADSFGVSKTTIFRVVNGKCYRHVEGLTPATLEARYRSSRSDNGRRGATVTNRRGRQ